MLRLSELVRRFHEDPQGVRGELMPAVLLWKEAPVTATKELIWQTLPRFAIGQRPHDPAVFAIRKHPKKTNAFALGVTVGRANNNDIVLEHGSVSRFHAYLQFDGSGDFRMFDADSSNGTFCNDQPVDRDQGARLVDGARIALGDVTLHFYRGATFEAMWLARSRLGPHR
ncbi:MAG: FHA domain-containing protein [Myxococcaceae bacterium]|nr:FHA domain-containing protein [Myxococcaceae bacterium]